MPNTVTEIGWYAFDECTSLESIVLPNNENYHIESFVFKDCISLKHIHSKVENPNDIYCYDNAFEGFNTDECILYVPNGTQLAYRNHKGFGKFKRIEIERGEE